MDAGDAIKCMLGNRPVRRQSWKGAVIGFAETGGQTKEVVMTTINGRTSIYQITAEDLQAGDWEAAV